VSRPLLVVLGVLISCGFSVAQSSDHVEVFGGYSLLQPDFSHVSGGPTNGWNASANFKILPKIGIVADFSGFYPSLGIRGGGFNTPVTNTITGSSYVSLFGPQVSSQFGRITPFGHFLIGESHLSPEKDNGTVIPGSVFTSTTALSYAAGGGVDYSLTRRLAVRGQVDWLHTTFGSADNQVHLVHNSARISTGVVFRF
jgi:opacity protein-like surface antigen